MFFIDRFLPDKELNYFEKQKLRAFVVFLFTLVLTILIIAIIDLVTYKTLSIYFWVTLISALYPFFILLLLKRVNYNLLADSVIIFLLLVIGVTINILKPDPAQVLGKYYRGLYILFSILVVAGFFATKIVMLLDYVVSILLVTRILVFALIHFKHHWHEFVAGYLFFVVMFTSVFVIILFARGFTDKAIMTLEAESEHVKRQNLYLKKIMNIIREISKQLLETSKNLENFSNKVAKGANAQASASEQLYDSISNLVKISDSNYQMSSYTNDLIQRLTKELSNSAETFENTINTVSEITQKINFVNDLADKTDILSINASIEAAHAGEHGKGFAVVASEIKKLADTTKSIANQIFKISKESKFLSTSTKEKLALLIPEIQKGAKLVEETLQLSAQQKQSIKSLNDLAENLASIASENANISEQLLSNASKLLSLAEKLDSLIEIINKS